jgi:hypothetical protein
MTVTDLIDQLTTLEQMHGRKPVTDERDTQLDAVHYDEDSETIVLVFG